MHDCLVQVLASGIFQGNDFYHKQLPGGAEPQNYVRSTVPSTHVNLYEMEKEVKREPKVQRPDRVEFWLILTL